MTPTKYPYQPIEPDGGRLHGLPIMEALLLAGPLLTALAMAAALIALAR